MVTSWEFQKIPPFNGVKATNVPVKQQNLVKEEINSLLEKNAIEIVPPSQIQEGLYSTFFLVPKKTGGMRPVINLKPLNVYLPKQHFKMDTLTKVINMVEKGDWAISIDLKDAYHHIMIFKGHRKFLRFQFQGMAYQFRCLCFGPTSAPRTFVKVMAVIVAHLRKKGLRLASYIDDWLNLNQSKQDLIENRDLLLSLLYRLGLMINKEKSLLVPVQVIIYLGSSFDLKKGLVFPTQERICSLKRAVLELLRGNITARQYLVVLGIIASCLELIPNLRLFTRTLQLHLLQNWNPARLLFSYQIALTSQVAHHLKWWLDTRNISKGRPLVKQVFSMTLTTDASGKWGWGGHMNNLTCQGQWSLMEKMLHINCLEMKAVKNCLQHFQLHIQNQNVLIRSDNIVNISIVRGERNQHNYAL